MFHKHPVNKVRNVSPASKVYRGYTHLLNDIGSRAKTRDGAHVLVVDGMHGSDFMSPEKVIINYCQSQQITPYIIHTTDFLKPEARLRAQFKDYITENRAFGYVGNCRVQDYFEQGSVNSLSSRLAAAADNASGPLALIVVIGVGAHWMTKDENALRIYLDVARENIQAKHAAGLQNFGMSGSQDNVEKYKVSYFLEWPALEKYREENFADFDYYVDTNRDDIVFTRPSTLIEMINDISHRPLRVKPFFAKGVWGGQYLKKLAQLGDNMVNCAWGFEPIAPENSILIEACNEVIEVPFLVVMAVAYENILGERIVKLFGNYFPIRFDYLDTIDGGNLSCQVHPTQNYIRKTFNEFLEQQESYYIMQAKDDAMVYLGLTEKCQPVEFVRDITSSQATGKPINLDDYVQSWPSSRGDLFLIPTGTVHCAGKNNLVLEISATTWWFTFKIYDYVRKGLDGRPRPINIDHALANIDFTRTTPWVRQNLIQQPRLLKERDGNSEYCLGKREDLLFYVNRIHLTTRWDDDTDGELLMLNLVEGEHVRIQSSKEPDVYVDLEFAESYIVPARFGQFTIINLGGSACKLIKAGVSPEWDVKLVDE